MFELLFKYPVAVFSKGALLFQAPWPRWALAAALVAAAAALAWNVARNRWHVVNRSRALALWSLQAAFLSLMLLVLWRPAVSISMLKPQQNVVAVLVDDSRSMTIEEQGATRLHSAITHLQQDLLPGFSQFQTRLYRMGSGLERINSSAGLHASDKATRIGAALRQIASESDSVPVGAVVLMSDGNDTTGGVDAAAIAALKQRRIPVHTIGFGDETVRRDLEITDASAPERVLSDSRVQATVTFRQRGFAGRTARIRVREGGKVMASRDITLAADGRAQTEKILFNSGTAGPRDLEIGVEPLAGETNTQNNSITRLLYSDPAKPKVLYIEGEPRWELKFIRRAIEEDPAIRLVTVLRTTENKLYRQGVDSPAELESGFPKTAEELFKYQAIVIGSIESAYFTPVQQELLHEFVDRRGGGVLLLGGRAALGEGGYRTPPLANLLPVRVPERKGAFRRDNAKAELTGSGRDSLICRLAEEPAENEKRWKKLPVIADYEDPGEVKPGATVLLTASTPSRTVPLLITQPYGHGRTAVFATGGSWRWRMMMEHTDRTHATFWRQLLRWLADGASGQVSASVAKQVLSDESGVALKAEVRDTSFRPDAGATVQARVMGPAGLMQAFVLAPDPNHPGSYTAEWNAPKPGSYLAELAASRGGEEVARDVVQFRREDGLREAFHTEQNRELLERIAQETGGSYRPARDAARLAKEIEFSEAGITVRETRDLWDMPAILLLAFALKGTEWLLRRRWGTI